jgi:DNA/RNA-binding domain of Phe-tRNA-synthetase-like protein
MLYFQHVDEIWRDFPSLVAGALYCEAITPDAEVGEQVGRFNDIAAARLETATESELPEVQAWRRAFSAMGLKPTQYRCASESLLRRFRKEKSLPSIHPLVDLCNAVSMSFAIPVAVYDIARVDQYLQVRRATGDETYLTFSGEVEKPEHGEVIFADASGRAHARRWTNRQSSLSAIRPATSSVLIVAEGLHDSAQADVPRLLGSLAGEIADIWPTDPRPAILNRSAPRFRVAE